MGLFHTRIPLRAASRWSVGKGYPPSWSEKSGWLGSPSSRVLMAWHYWEDFTSTIHSLRSPSLVAVWAFGASRASVPAAEGMAHLILQQCCIHQGPSVGISCSGQSFLTGVSLHIHEPVLSGMVPGVKFGLRVEPRDASWTLSQFLPWKCRKPLTLEAFFDIDQDLLANMCLHLFITEYLPWQPL